MTKWRVLFHFVTVAAFALAVALLAFTAESTAAIIEVADLLAAVTR